MIRKLFSRNAEFQQIEVLRHNRNKRHKQRLFFVEGVRNLNEAVRMGWRVRSLVYGSEAPLSRWAAEVVRSIRTEVNYELTAALMAELSGKSDPSELIALVEMRDADVQALDLGERPLLALFDRPSNRGNLGTIMRSCDALGVDALVLTGHGVDMHDPETLAASMGSFFALPVVQVDGHEALLAWIALLRTRYAGFAVVGTSAQGAVAVDAVDLTLPTLLLLGNETDGLSHALQGMCDALVTIPMAETSAASSLNVACAATVLFYEARRQRR